ncbi:MAG: glycine cleavage system H protein [Polaribacter sp.]|jgi:glycine cleavage system H protein
MTFPKDLKYSKEHEWVRMIDDTTAYIGISEFAAGELGELVYVEVDTVGEVVDKDGVFGTVEAVKTTSDLYMPLSAKVIEFNPALDENEGDNPTLINEDPYGQGWIVKIELQNPEELGLLMDAEAYTSLVE